MIQAGAKTLAFKGFKQKKQRKVKHATPQGDYGLYMVKSRSHWSGFSIFITGSHPIYWSSSLDNSVLLLVYAVYV